MDKPKDIHIRIPKELYTKLKVKCAYSGISMQHYITTLINENKYKKSLRQKKALPDS